MRLLYAVPVCAKPYALPVCVTRMRLLYAAFPYVPKPYEALPVCGKPV